MEPQPTTTAKATPRTKVQDLLLEEDARSIFGSMGLVVRGGGVCLGVGVVFAVGMWFGLYMTFESSFIGLLGWFAVYLVITVPLLIWWEKKVRQDYVLETIRASDAPAPELPSLEPTSKGPIGWLLWAPTALVTGLAGVQKRWSARQLAVFSRAAEIILDVAKDADGLLVRQVLHAPENMPIFAAAVDWLERNDWLGKTSDGQRMWLTTSAKSKLAKSQLMPRQSINVR